MDNQSQVYLAFDADSAGRKVGNAILDDNPNELLEVSKRIQHGNDLIFAWAKQFGGKCYSSGGDQGLFLIPEEAVHEIEQLRKDYQFAVGLTVSIGIGHTLSEAGKALLVAKFKGKDQTVTYDPSIEDEIAGAKQRVEAGSASEEERKLADAYLQPKEQSMNESEDDCQYCKEMSEDPDHCKYCHDMDEEKECKYCDEAEQEEQTQEHEHTGDYCEYCKEADSKAQAEANDNDPTTESGEDYADAGMNPPAIDKPADDQPAPGLGHNSDAPTNNNTRLEDPTRSTPDQMDSAAGDIYDEDQHSEAAMAAIVSEIDEGIPGETPRSEMENIDVEDTPVDGSMEGNVSRPDHYKENVPSDMGLSEENESEDGPDLSNVLQEGLDSHSDNIKKEKVVQMVGAALEGFKASKDVLEKAKEQAPQLYEASIAMLKAMIEMAKMLGLGENSAENSESPVGAQGDQVVSDLEQPSEESEEGFPDNREPAHFAHPKEQAAAPQEDAAPGKKAQSQ